jgi:hypothetical protein
MDNYFIIDQFNEKQLTDEILMGLTEVKYYNIFYVDNEKLRKLVNVKKLDVVSIAKQICDADLLPLTELEYLDAGGSIYLTKNAFQHMKKLKMVIYGNSQVINYK